MVGSGRIQGDRRTGLSDVRGGRDTEGRESRTIPQPSTVPFTKMAGWWPQEGTVEKRRELVSSEVQSGVRILWIRTSWFSCS